MNKSAYCIRSLPTPLRCRIATLNTALLCLGAIVFAAAPNYASTLYGISISQDNLVAIDTTTHATATIGPLGVNSMQGLAYDSIRDRLLGVSYDGNLYSINRTTGAAAYVGSTGIGIQYPGLDFDPNTGTLYLSSSPFYAAGQYTSSLYKVNPTTGAATRIGGFTSNIIVDGLAFNPNANILYGVSSQTYQIYGVNTANAQLTGIAGTGVPLIFTEAAYDVSANLLYWTDAGRSALYSRNMTTGAQGLVGGIPYEIRGLAFAAVPEPATTTVAGLGLATLLLGRRIKGISSHKSCPTRRCSEPGMSVAVASVASRGPGR